MPNEGLSGPHLAAAFLCERVLMEKDNVPSFIRAVERFTVPVLPKGIQLPPGVMPPPNVIQFTIVIMLKSGDFGSGRANLKISVLKPNGEELQAQAFPVFFNGGDDNGVAVLSPIAIPDPDEGLHWFDVYFEESRITRIPLRVLHQPLQFMPGPTHG